MIDEYIWSSRCLQTITSSCMCQRLKINLTSFNQYITSLQGWIKPKALTSHGNPKIKLLKAKMYCLPTTRCTPTTFGIPNQSGSLRMNWIFSTYHVKTWGPASLSMPVYGGHLQKKAVLLRGPLILSVHLTLLRLRPTQK